MALLFTITQGWTKQLGPFVIKVNGSPLDLTAMTVKLKIRPAASSTFVDTTGDVTVDPNQVANKGWVFFKPDATDFLASKSPYAAHWEITDSSGDVVFAPHGDPDSVKVAKV